MTVAGRMAHTFVRAAREKRAEADVSPRYFSREDIPGVAGADRESLRQEFEESLSKEEILRQKAREYARLARQRAEDQPGAGREFFRRLMPVPYTGGEAAWRLPAIAAGGAGGWYGLPWLMGDTGAKAKARANLEELARTLRMDVEQQRNPLVDQLLSAMPAGAAADPINMQLQNARLTELAELAGRGAASPGAQRLQANLLAVGVPRERLQEAYLRAATGSARGREAMQFFEAARRWPKWVGGAGGLAAGSLLTGLPMAIRAGALRRTGGELSFQARKRMRKAIEKAEREQFKRENVVRMIRGEPPLPLSEWRGRHKQLREDWRSANREYRGEIKARRKGRKPPADDEAKEASLNDLRSALLPIPTEVLMPLLQPPSTYARGLAMSLPGKLGTPLAGAIPKLESLEGRAAQRLAKLLKGDNMRSLMRLLPLLRRR